MKKMKIFDIFYFQALNETEDAQLTTLKSVFELWHSHQQMMVVLVDKMHKTQIVECAAVANWLFSREMVNEFTKAYSWEVLHLTIRKMNKHVNKLSKEASDARKMIEDSESDSEDSDDENKRNGDRGARRSNKSGEKPSEDQVEKLEERLEAAQADQKNLFLIIFQRFIMILSEHLVRCDTDGIDFKTPWYRWTVGRLQQIFLMVSCVCFMDRYTAGVFSLDNWNKLERNGKNIELADNFQRDFFDHFFPPYLRVFEKYFECSSISLVFFCSKLACDIYLCWDFANN